MEKFWRDRKTADEVQVIKIIIYSMLLTLKSNIDAIHVLQNVFQHLKTMLPLKSSVCINE